MAFDPWSTTTKSANYTQVGTREFKKTLVERAAKRVDDVVRMGGRDFVVLGNPKFNDGYDKYEVRWRGGDEYSCSCEALTHGDTRARNGCSHIVAVMLYRENNGKIADGRQATAPPFDNRSANHQQPSNQLALGVNEPSTDVQQRDELEAGSSGSNGSVTNNLLLPTLPSISDSLFYSWDTTPLPPKFQELRPHQWNAIAEAIEHYERGVDVVYLDAPTGSGKSLIGELIRRILQQRAFYICHSKTLQQQFLHDFPYAKLLMGRSNYPTLDGPSETTCADCTSSSPDVPCMWCDERDECPYQVAKAQAINSKLAIINTAYFLTEFNYVGHIGKQREFGIVDECDTLEGELMGFAEFYIGERLLSKLHLTAPKEGSHYKTISTWLVDEMKPALIEYRKTLRGDDLKTIRERMSTSRVLADVLRIEEQAATDPEMSNWIRDNNAGPLVLKPVTVSEYGERYVWGHAKKWLHMSATIISADELSSSCGLQGNQGEGEQGRPWEVVSVPMTFPVENRQVIIAPVADMSKKGKENGEWEYAATALRSIADRHPNDRILVHTVSYDLARFVMERVARSLDRPVFTYQNASARDSVLARFTRTERSILVAPSMDRGVDLADDDCRVVVIMKVPFPYLGDPQVSKRMRLPGGQSWYAVQAVRKLVQMAGRATRSADDWSVTYILDRQMTSNIMKKHSHLLPRWFKEAFDTRFNVRELLRAG